MKTVSYNLYVCRVVHYAAAASLNTFIRETTFLGFYCCFLLLLCRNSPMVSASRAEPRTVHCCQTKPAARQGKARHSATIWRGDSTMRQCGGCVARQQWRPLEFRGNQTMRNNYPRRQEITYHSPVTTISILISDPHGPISIVHLCLISVEIWKRNFVGVRLEDREN